MDEDFKWYKANLSDLYQKYGDVYLIIKNKTMLGTSGTYADAVHHGKELTDIGTFIVQKCGRDESAYTEYIM